MLSRQAARAGSSPAAGRWCLRSCGLFCYLPSSRMTHNTYCQRAELRQRRSLYYTDGMCTCGTCERRRQPTPASSLSPYNASGGSTCNSRTSARGVGSAAPTLRARTASSAQDSCRFCGFLCRYRRRRKQGSICLRRFRRFRPQRRRARCQWPAPLRHISLNPPLRSQPSPSPHSPPGDTNAHTHQNPPPVL